MHDVFIHESLTPTDLERLAAARAGDSGPGLVQHMRELLQPGGPGKRRVNVSALRDIAAAAMRRDLTSTSAPAGGYLIGTSTTPLEAILQRYSILTEAGVNIVSGLSGPVTVPTINTQGGVTWLPTDGSSIVDSDPVFGQGAMQPRFAAAKIDVSRQLMLQAPVSQVVGIAIGEAIGRGVDSAIMNGTGASGQPLGILNKSGVFSQSGTSLQSAGLRAMRKAVLLAGAREDRLTWLGAPDVQELLGSREFSAGSGRVLWADGKIEGLPAVASFLVPAGSLVLGDFSRVTAGIFDSAGVSIELNPFENFMTGLCSFRLILPVDFLASPAAAFAVARSIT